MKINKQNKFKTRICKNCLKIQIKKTRFIQLIIMMKIKKIFSNKNHQNYQLIQKKIINKNNKIKLITKIFSNKQIILKKKFNKLRSKILKNK